MVLFSGGVKQDDDARVLEQVKRYMECGATGVMFGRNMWLRPFDKALALSRAVHAIMARHPALSAGFRQEAPMAVSRRQWLGGLGAGVLAGARTSRASPRRRKRPEAPPANGPLALKDFEPKSMLHVPETRVAALALPRHRHPHPPLRHHEGRRTASRSAKR